MVIYFKVRFSNTKIKFLSLYSLFFQFYRILFFSYNVFKKITCKSSWRASEMKRDTIRDANLSPIVCVCLFMCICVYALVCICVCVCVCVL